MAGQGFWPGVLAGRRAAPLPGCGRLGHPDMADYDPNHFDGLDDDLDMDSAAFNRLLVAASAAPASTPPLWQRRSKPLLTFARECKSKLMFKRKLEEKERVTAEIEAHFQNMPKQALVLAGAPVPKRTKRTVEMTRAQAATLCRASFVSPRSNVEVGGVRSDMLRHVSAQILLSAQSAGFDSFVAACRVLRACGYKIIADYTHEWDETQHKICMGKRVSNAGSNIRRIPNTEYHCEC